MDDYLQPCKYNFQLLSTSLELVPRIKLSLKMAILQQCLLSDDAFKVIMHSNTLWYVGVCMIRIGMEQFRSAHSILKS